MLVPDSYGEFVVSEARGIIEDISSDALAAAQAVAGTVKTVATGIASSAGFAPRGRSPPQKTPEQPPGLAGRVMHANEPSTPEIFQIASRSPVGRSGGLDIPSGRLETGGRAESLPPAFLPQSRQTSKNKTGHSKQTLLKPTARQIHQVLEETSTIKLNSATAANPTDPSSALTAPRRSSPIHPSPASKSPDPRNPSQ